MKHLLIAFSLLLPLCIEAQHQLGWRTDHYAGINAALLNPANTAQTPYSWDLNIGEASFFLTNNYTFLENSSIPSLLKQMDNDNSNFYLRDDLPSDFKIRSDEFVYDFKTEPDYYVQLHASVLGPSLSVRVAPMTRIGVFSRWQTMTTLKGLDSDLGYDTWDAIHDGDFFTLNPFRAIIASWSELGFNLSQGFELNNGDLYFGLNARKLYGQRGAYFTNKDNFELSKVPPNTVGLEGIDFDLEAGFTNNILSDDNLTDAPGSGWGFDFGFSYLVDYVDGYYRWEFGAAVLDIGQIIFQNAQVHRFNTDVIGDIVSDNYESLNFDQNFQVAAQQLSQDVLNDPLASLQSTEMVIHLPTTLHFQAAYHFNEWIKIYGHVLTSIAPSGVSLNRMTTIGIIPRMDRHWWSLALPVSFYAGNQLRLGASVRLGPFFIGTDQIGSFIKGDELTGTDIYMGIKFFPLGLFNKSKSKSRKKGKGNGKEVKCYDF